MGILEVGVVGAYIVGMGVFTASLITSPVRVNRLEDLSPWKYHWGDFKGKIGGRDSPELSQFAFLKDIERTKYTMSVAVADSDFIDDSVLDALEHRVDKVRLKGATIFKPAFVVGPNTNTPKLQELANQEYVGVSELPRDPPCNIRVIDDGHTFVSGSGMYCWTFGSMRAVRDRSKAIGELKIENYLSGEAA